MSGTERDRLDHARNSWLVLLMALAIGVLLGVWVYGTNVMRIDLETTRFVQRWDGAVPAALTSIGNAVGSTAWAASAIVGAIALAVWKRARREVVYLAALLVLRLLATQLKPIFDSPRPPGDLVDIVGTWHGTGYPSGHSLTGAAMALGLVVLVRRHLTGWTRLAATGVLVTMMLIVGFARIWSGAHWLTDVIGGYAFGTAVVAGAVLVTAWWERTNQARRSQP